MKRLLLLFLVLAGISIVLDSCVPVFRAGFDVTDLKIEKRANGYLLKFTANKPIKDVEAFVSQSNWLVITIANASIDLNKIKSAKPIGIIRKIETELFDSSVQVSMELSEKVGPVEVVHDAQSNNFFVDIFMSHPK